MAPGRVRGLVLRMARATTTHTGPCRPSGGSGRRGQTRPVSSRASRCPVYGRPEPGHRFPGIRRSSSNAPALERSRRGPGEQPPRSGQRAWRSSGARAMGLLICPLGLRQSHGAARVLRRARPGVCVAGSFQLPPHRGAAIALVSDRTGTAVPAMDPGVPRIRCTRRRGQASL
jgi:hypothetical protein